MLFKLLISNYAIIDQLEIRFSGNLNIITGETGAGKSILMGALGLVLGERADSSVLQDKSRKCIVEASFSVIGKVSVSEFLKLNDLDQDNEITVRREIGSNGKSRSFINDTPVNLSQLKELSLLLVDLHQQFDTLDVGTERFQRNVLDAFAGNNSLLQELSVLFNDLSEKKKQLNHWKQLQSDAVKELDYNRFLFEEFESLALKENELEQLDAELVLLTNAENIKLQLGEVFFSLKDSETPIVQQVKSAQQKLESLVKFHPSIEPLSERLKSVVIELKDIAGDVEQVEGSVIYDQERIAIVNDRIAAGYKLLKKHNVSTTAELLNIQEEISKKLDAVVNVSSTIDKYEKEVSEGETACNKIAEKISANRKAQVKSFSDKVNSLLKQVGMPNAKLSAAITQVPLNETGIDSISFLFNANSRAGRDEPANYEPLRKVASGGELSRVMLSIKSLVARKLMLPTLIFDEIDTGISGEASRQVGIIMKDLAETHQVISITHQPQIAAKADAHYFVYKKVIDDRIVTSVKLLNKEERINAIAQMLSGERPTEAAIKNAREMVAG